MESIASTISTLQSFPGPNSIPPPCFYQPQGLASWLNLNSEYKLPFSYTGAFPYLFPPSYTPSTASSIRYNVSNVPLCSNVQTLSQYQALKYNQQLQLFQKVYAYNSNAYINSLQSSRPPVYYNFLTYNEKNEYDSAVALVNKLYPFQAMASAPGVNWFIPFPISM
jgi:hypothetical protein